MTTIIKIIQEASLKHASLRRLSRKVMKIKTKPWLTKGLLKSIATKNKLFQLCYKKQNLRLIAKHKRYLNKLTKLKQAAKRMYYHNEFFVHKNNIISKQWGIINEVLSNKKKCEEVTTSLIDSENKIIVDR